MIFFNKSIILNQGNNIEASYYFQEGTANSVKLLNRIDNYKGYIQLYTELDHHFEIDDLVYISFKDLTISDQSSTLDNFLEINQLEDFPYLDQARGYRILNIVKNKNSFVIERFYSSLNPNVNLTDHFVSKIKIENVNIENGYFNSVLCKKGNINGGEYKQIILNSGELNNVDFVSKYKNNYLTLKSSINNDNKNISRNFNRNNNSFGYTYVGKDNSDMNLYLTDVSSGNFKNCYLYGTGNTIEGGYFENCVFDNYEINNGYFKNCLILDNCIWNYGTWEEDIVESNTQKILNKVNGFSNGDYSPTYTHELAFDDNHSGAAWVSNIDTNLQTGNGSRYIGYDFGTDTSINRFQLTCIVAYGREPVDFRFEGYDGFVWKIIKEYTNVNWDVSTSSINDFYLDEYVNYSKYRIFVTKTSGGPVVSLREFKFYGSGIVESNFKLDKWNNGIWNQGYKNNLNWINGTFNNGLFEYVQWDNGIMNNGTILNSDWNNGTFNQGILSGVTWNNGRFNNGLFENSTWNNGSYFNGLFKNSTWNNGTFFNGNIQYSDWYDGRFKKGTFSRSTWYNGTFINGVFQYSRWENGYWYNGTFRNCNTYNNSWINGIFYRGLFIDSIWNTGIWYNGQFVNSRWENGYWYNGRVDNGIFKNVYWKNGTFNSGYFDNSEVYIQEWSGGTFNNGNIGFAKNNDNGLYYSTLPIKFSGTTTYIENIDLTQEFSEDYFISVEFSPSNVGTYNFGPNTIDNTNLYVASGYTNGDNSLLILTGESYVPVLTGDNILVVREKEYLNYDWSDDIQLNSFIKNYPGFSFSLSTIGNFGITSSTKNKDLSNRFKKCDIYFNSVKLSPQSSLILEIQNNTTLINSAITMLDNSLSTSFFNDDNLLLSYDLSNYINDTDDVDIRIYVDQNTTDETIIDCRYISVNYFDNNVTNGFDLEWYFIESYNNNILKLYNNNNNFNKNLFFEGNYYLKKEEYIDSFLEHDVVTIESGSTSFSYYHYDSNLNVTKFYNGSLATYYGYVSPSSGLNQDFFINLKFKNSFNWYGGVFYNGTFYGNWKGGSWVNGSWNGFNFIKNSFEKPPSLYLPPWEPKKLQ